MYNKKWFKLLVWSSSVFFFFLSGCVLIASLGPSPNEGQVHQWMAAMMGAMEKSLMGFSMQLEEDSQLAYIIYSSGHLILPTAIGGFLTGLLVRSLKTYGKKTK